MSSSSTINNCNQSYLEKEVKEAMEKHLGNLSLNTKNLYKLRQAHWEVRCSFSVIVILIVDNLLLDYLCIFYDIFFCMM